MDENQKPNENLNEKEKMIQAGINIETVIKVTGLTKEEILNDNNKI